MALPIVSYTETKANSPSFRWTVSGSRQKKPYNIGTNYVSDKLFSTTGEHSWSWSPDNLRDGTGTAAANQAYARFVGQLGDVSSFGATLTAERKETLSMVATTVTKLFFAARDVKNLRLADAAKKLGLPYKERVIKVRLPRGKSKRGKPRRPLVVRRRVFELPSGRTVQKTLANGWLFYSYGVKPLASDIYNGMDVLQRPTPDRVIKASATGRSSDNYIPWSWTTYTSNLYLTKVKVRYGGIVRVTNPNLFLANQMGLTNPVQWVNEAIPFSFVIDWFSNLSSVIGSLTDFQGVSLTGTWVSRSTEISYTRTSFPLDPPLGRWYQYSNKRWIQYKRTYGGIPPPKLQFAYERPSLQRALNAISLLVGFLPRK